MPASSPDDSVVEQWVDAWQAGTDPEGNFRLLFERYSGAVFAFFRKRGFALEECDDLVQETFLGVHRGLARFRREVAFESWLFELSTNAFRKALRFRSAKKRRGQEESLSERSDLRPDAASSEAAQTDEMADSWASPMGPAALRRLLGQERLKTVLQELGKLPPQMRRCAILAWCDGYSNHEISALLEISPQTVKVQHLKARRRLRDHLLSVVDAGRRS